MNTAIDQSKIDFDATMKTLKPTLQAAVTILHQTRPHAFLHFSEDVLTTPPSVFRENFVGLNTSYINYGNADAALFKWKVEIYIGKPDDLATQKQLVAQFEETMEADSFVPGCKKNRGEEYRICNRSSRLFCGRYKENREWRNHIFSASIGVPRFNWDMVFG